jgi:kynureninase
VIRDDIIRMAREAWDRDTDPWLTYEQAFLTRFAALVAAAEREAILQMSADNWFKTQAEYDAAIRARSNP